ncbi:MAG: hypothetical protein CMH57_06105 [Myxococcales bacterium]|nr:hypothetical protein [Myxococcales bacterium]
MGDWRGRLFSGAQSAAEPLLLAVGVLLALAPFLNDAPGPCNDSSRLATAQALVESGRFAIDDTYFAYTCDRIVIDGTSYSDKPPVLSLLLAALYGLGTVALGLDVARDLGTLYPLMALLSSGVAFAATAVGVRRLALALGAGRGAALLTAVVAVFGTLMFTYSAAISNHPIGAALLIWLVVVVVEALQPAQGPQLPTGRGALVGALAAGAVVVDPLAVTVAAPLTLLLLVRKPGFPGALGVALGASPLLAAHVAVCLAVAGHPLALNLDPAYFEYEGSMHSTRNLSGTGWKHGSLGAFLSYAFHSLLGHRGLLIYSPPVLLGLIGVGLLARREESAARDVAAAVGLGVVGFLGLTLGFSSNFSGWSYGVRWHALIAPLLVGVGGGAVAVVAPERRRAWLGALVALGVVGAVLGGIGTINPWTVSMNSGEHSVVEQLTADEAYVRRDLTNAAYFLKRDHYVEAAHAARLALVRDPIHPDAWFFLIQASRGLRDQGALAEAREAIVAGRFEAATRARLLATIDAPLE